MKYEIEMLSLGNADASIIRYINEAGVEYVILIDAGNPKDGQVIMQQIRKYCNQDYIDLAICTHPDKDHIGGFFDIIGKMKILEFWIHDPSEHVDVIEIKKSISESKLEKSLSFITESFNDSKNLLELIDKNKIIRYEPFTGLKHSVIPITVVGPTEEYYEDKLSGFRDIDVLTKEASNIEKSIWDILEDDVTLSETLDENDDKSSENNSSVICAFVFDEKIFLFTGDAGPEALMRANDDYELSNIHWLKVPHHGSKKNLNSELILHYKPKIAYIPANGTRNNPSRAVVDSLKKVDCSVYSAAKANILHNSIEDRKGYIDATPL